MPRNDNGRALGERFDHDTRKSSLVTLRWQDQYRRGTDQFVDVVVGHAVQPFDHRVTGGRLANQPVERAVAHDLQRHFESPPGLEKRLNAFFLGKPADIDSVATIADADTRLGIKEVGLYHDLVGGKPSFDELPATECAQGYIRIDGVLPGP